VQFVGEVFDEKKEALFAHSDVVLVPSHVENVAILIGLETNHCGLWVDNDTESLALAIRKIRTLLLQEMGQRGRKWMQDDFSWASVSKQLLDVDRDCVRHLAAGCTVRAVV
jgi:glycosyltransferase involved in cell wall biosynthesis